MPAASFLFALANPRYDWAYKAEPDPTRGGRRDYMPRGKVLGGTSSINGMSYVRGQPADYDGWAALGCRGWDFASVLPYFKRSEDNENGADAHHGTGGPLAVSNAHAAPAVGGLSPVLRRHGPAARGRYQHPAAGGRRLRARHPAQGAAAQCRPRRANAGADPRPCAARAVRRQPRGRGEYTRRGRIVRAEAAGAVILCAGAFASPQILLLSGVGPAAQLRAFDIPVVHDLPGVGENLQDHPGLAQTCWASVTTYNMQTGPLHALVYGAQWLLMGRPGFDARSPPSCATTGGRNGPTSNTSSRPPASI